ncbi:MAG: lipoyl(octanoyl) transferase LipB [Pseudomonadota bacterium]
MNRVRALGDGQGAGIVQGGPGDDARPEARSAWGTGRWHWLGRVPFARTAALQDVLRARVVDNRLPETLLLLEHDPVITLGRNADFGNVLHTEASLAARGVSLHQASRGGDVTYHGPGQLVGYPIFHLRAGVRAHVEGMATAIAVVLAEIGVTARYRREAPGLWVQTPEAAGAGESKIESKICAFGVKVHRRVTTHGFALNLDPDLEAFRLIVPCGLPGGHVTSVARLRGSSPSAGELAARVAAAFGTHLKVAFEEGDASILNCNTEADP